MAKDLLIPAERIGRAILLIRGQKVLLDRDLAELYGVPTKSTKRFDDTERGFPRTSCFSCPRKSSRIGGHKL
jgi:ORF6N domain